MVRTKKAKNVVKLDVGEFSRGRGGKVLPLVVQQSSKDRRRVEQKVHAFFQAPPELQSTPVFNPVPVFESVTDDASPDTDESEEDLSDPLRVWGARCDLYLQDFMLLEGRMGDESGMCRTCPNAGNYRCVDCMDGSISCGDCIVDNHAFNPFHRIQRWTGAFFRRDTLWNLGQRVQLGHRVGETCTRPQRSTRPFTVIHTNGVHQVDILFCSCNFTPLHGDRVQQLLRRRIFPATSTDPQTGSTFAFLKFAHLLSAQSKLSLYDLYISVETLTDATGVSEVKDRYREFLRMVRMWCHLHLMKRGGRAHDPTGVKGTAPGELAVLCPACPHPDINLPDGWMYIGQDKECIQGFISQGSL